MKYIIDKDDLYGTQEESVTVEIGDIIEIEVLPFVGEPYYETGKLIEINNDCLKIDASTLYNSCINTWKLERIISLEVVSVSIPEENIEIKNIKEILTEEQLETLFKYYQEEIVKIIEPGMDYDKPSVIISRLMKLENIDMIKDIIAIILTEIGSEEDAKDWYGLMYHIQNKSKEIPFDLVLRLMDSMQTSVEEDRYIDKLIDDIIIEYREYTK